MSYEYKEEILSDIGPEPNCNYESESNRYYDKIDELDHVYRQAAKADEYEAKAKAFDAYHGTIQSHLHLKGEPEFSSSSTEVLSDLIDIHEDYERYAYDQILKLINKYESGDHNV